MRQLCSCVVVPYTIYLTIRPINQSVAELGQNLHLFCLVFLV